MTINAFQEYAKRLTKRHGLTVNLSDSTYTAMCIPSRNEIMLTSHTIPHEQIDCLKILLDHEIGHFLFPAKYDDCYSSECNVIDDIRIEKQFEKLYPGTTGQFKQLRETLKDRQESENAEPHLYSSVGQYLSGIPITENKEIIEEWAKDFKVWDLLNIKKFDRKSQQAFYDAAKGLYDLLQEHARKEQKKLQQEKKQQASQQQGEEKQGEQHTSHPQKQQKAKEQQTKVDTLLKNICDAIMKHASQGQGANCGGSIITSELPISNKHLDFNNSTSHTPMRQDAFMEILLQLLEDTKLKNIASNSGDYNSKAAWKIASNNMNYIYSRKVVGASEPPVISVLLDISGSMHSNEPYKLAYNREYINTGLDFIATVADTGLPIQAYYFHNDLNTIKAFDDGFINGKYAFYGSTELANAINTCYQMGTRRFSNRKQIMIVLTDEVYPSEFRKAALVAKDNDINMLTLVINHDAGNIDKTVRLPELNIQEISVDTIESGFEEGLLNLLNKTML